VNKAAGKKAIGHAVKQAASLLNANVFQQQAGVNAPEQPTFRSRKKADALKELISSIPLEDQKKARGDMNTLLTATKNFDGKGSVKADGKGLWKVKGMSTSLKPYQVLGSAFMRRRENAADEPRGGLMADQMGLGKTLMMIGMCIEQTPLNRTDSYSEYGKRSTDQERQRPQDDPACCKSCTIDTMEERNRIAYRCIESQDKDHALRRWYTP
jgi:hypothetical protein